MAACYKCDVCGSVIESVKRKGIKIGSSQDNLFDSEKYYDLCYSCYDCFKDLLERGFETKLE